MTEPSPQRLFLLCGLPFSGKSTLSRALHDRFGVAHVEVDRYMFGLGGEDGRPGANDWLPAYRLAIDEIKTHLRAGRSVVFDAVGHQRRHRRRMQRLADQVGARMTLIHLDVSVEEARERLLANRLNQVRTNVPDDGFAQITREMEPPGPDERALVYRPSEPLALWLERTVAPLLAGPAVLAQEEHAT